MKTDTRKYKALCIIDNRGKEDSLDKLVDGIKEEFTAVGATVTGVENYGRKDFARVTDNDFPGAPYVEIQFTGTSTVPAAIKERTRHNQTLYRVCITA